MVLKQPDAIELAGIRFEIGVAEEALTRNPDDTDILRYLAHAYTVVGRNAEGLHSDRRLVELLPADARVRYNLACSYALTGDTEDALATLEKACELGFDDLELLSNDEDLSELRDEERFHSIQKKIARDR